jgi:hypothetical protein
MLVFFLGKSGSKASALKKIVAFAIAIAAVIFAVKPSIADQVAHFIGVARGADLIFYIFVVIVMFQTVERSLRAKEARKREAKFIRKISLMQKDLDELREATEAGKDTK